MDRMAGALLDAQVDLNPHQIDAALFATSNPLSKGAILADEVGLGKTIEAGLLIAQRWAERKRRLLIITPANLRKQWHQELADKFGLPAVILEAKSFRQSVKDGTPNPFDRVADAARSDIDSLYALPNSQRQLITLVLRKLLASSTFAIAGALDSILRRLRQTLEDKTTIDLAEALDTDYESLDQTAEELGELGEDETRQKSAQELAAIRAEIADLQGFRSSVQVRRAAAAAAGCARPGPPHLLRQAWPCSDAACAAPRTGARGSSAAVASRSDVRRPAPAGPAAGR